MFAQDTFLLICEFLPLRSVFNFAECNKYYHKLIQSDEGEQIYKQALHTTVPHLAGISCHSYRTFLRHIYEHVIVVGSDSYEDVTLIVKEMKKVGLKKVREWNTTKKGEPTLDDLRKYRAIFIFGDGCAFKSVTLLGNSLVDYVERGFGSVVLATYAHCSNVSGGYLGGEWRKRKWFPIPPGSQSNLLQCSKTYTLEPLVSDHLILKGCEDVKFSGQMSDKSLTMEMSPDATVIATFSNGEQNPAIAEMLVERTTGSKVPIVGLNFFPKFDPYHKEVEYKNVQKILVNALLYVMSNNEHSK